MVLLSLSLTLSRSVYLPACLFGGRSILLQVYLAVCLAVCFFLALSLPLTRSYPFLFRVLSLVRTVACAVLCLPSRVITRENAASFPLFSLLLALALSGALSLSFSSSCSCSYSPFRVLLRFIYSYIIENILTSYLSLFTYFCIFSSLSSCLYLWSFQKMHVHILYYAPHSCRGNSRARGLQSQHRHLSRRQSSGARRKCALGATYVPPSSMAWQLGHSRRHFRDEWSAQRACAVRVLVLHPSREGRRRLPSESPAFCESPLHPLGPTSQVMNEPSSHSSTDYK